MNRHSVAASRKSAAVRQNLQPAALFRDAATPRFFSRIALALLLLVGMCAVHGAVPGESSAAFEQANKLYEQGKYAESAAAYEALIQSGKVSGPLYFNYANALFKSGQIGRAVFNYRLAEQLSPRDPDIRANLRFARETVQSPTARPERWKDWLRLFTLNELTVMTVAALWTWFILLIFQQLRAEWRKGLKGYTTTAGMACLVLGAWLALAAYVRLENQLAVVVVPEAVVRYGPLEESQSFFTLRDGTELSVLDRKNNWFQVQDGNGRVGWLRSDQVATVTPVAGSGKS